MYLPPNNQTGSHQDQDPRGWNG